MAHSRARVRYPLRLRARRYELPLRRRRRTPSTTVNPNKQGAATGTITWAGTATGARTSAGAATGTITWAGTATGTSNEVTSFLETFDDSSALVRGVMANFRGQWDDETASNLDGQDTTQGAGPDVPDNIHVTAGKLVIESGMQNYGDSQWRSLTPFAGTGTIEVDIEDSGLSPETQVVILLTDRPYAMTGFEGENANTPHPQYGIGIYNGYIIRTWSDYDQTDYYQGGTPGPPNGTREIGVEQHWVINFNSTHMWVTIDTDDINVGEDIGGGVRRVPLPDGFDLTGARVVLGTHNHASRKYTPFVDTCEVIFDNLEYTGLAAERSAIVAPSTSSERFGWQLVENGVGTPIVHSTPSLSKGTGTEAWLLLNVGCFADDIDSLSLLHYSLNSNTEHTAAFRVATNEIGTFTLSVPVDIAEVVHGVNTIEVSISDPVANAGSIRYANLSLVVAGGSPTVPVSDGEATGTITWVGSATGTRTSAGASTGTITWAGAATGTRTPTGAATGAITWAGAATGVRSPKAAATGAIGWAGSATGEAPGVGVSDGSGNGQINWVGSATGARSSPGAGIGSVAWVGVVTGTRIPKGAATGAVTWSGTADGDAPVPGQNDGEAVGAITWAGAATGVRSPKAAATGAIGWAGVATSLVAATDVYRTRNSYREASARGYREPNSRGYREPRSTGYGGN